MPGTSYGISAKKCNIGRKLAKIKGSVCFDCYALKANYFYPSVEIAHKARLKGIARAEWTGAMVTLLKRAHSRGRGRNGKFAKGWHRWHDSGDLQSVEHLIKICAVAALTPHIRHWLPTRELAIVKAYQGTIPANLTIRVSATMVDGAPTTQWPTVSAVHDSAPAQGYSCPASQRKGELKGKCGPCRACWNPAVPVVSYPKH
jgi:Gene product 88